MTQGLARFKAAQVAPDGRIVAPHAATTPATCASRAASKRFGETVAVAAVTLAVQQREFVTLLGPSGCGKTTTLRMVAGLEQNSTGRISIGGEDLATVPAVPPADEHDVPVRTRCFRTLSVAGNVAFGLRQERPPMRARADPQRASTRCSTWCSCGTSRPRRPHELSGGQQQRVALARSLAREPKLLLLDEPLSALDKKIRQRTQLELVALIRRVGVTCIMVTHDQEEAMTMADRIGVMSPQGELLQVGPPGELYERPAYCYVAEFVGETNLFAGRVSRGALHVADFPAPLVLPPEHGLAEGRDAWLSVRPERAAPAAQRAFAGG